MGLIEALVNDTFVSVQQRSMLWSSLVAVGVCRGKTGSDMPMVEGAFQKANGVLVPLPVSHGVQCR